MKRRGFLAAASGLLVSPLSAVRANVSEKDRFLDWKRSTTNYHYDIKNANLDEFVNATVEKFQVGKWRDVPFA